MDAELATMIEGLRRGDAAATAAFFRRFGPALRSVADRRIAPGLARRFDAPEVASSVCRTFLRRAGEGEFDIEDGDALWRLLCAITLTKVREKARFHRREKRSVTREVDVESPGEARAGGGTAPDDDVAFADALGKVLDELDEDERRLVDWRLAGRSTEEIADELGCSDRTVRRQLARLEARFDDLLSRSDG